MPYFDRFDICQAHYLFARHYQVGGDTERNDFARLNRMQFKPGLSLKQWEDPDKALTENGAAIYRQLERDEARRYARWRAARKADARRRRSILNPGGESRLQGQDPREVLRENQKAEPHQ